MSGLQKLDFCVARNQHEVDELQIVREGLDDLEELLEGGLIHAPCFGACRGDLMTRYPRFT